MNIYSYNPKDLGHLIDLAEKHEKKIYTEMCNLTGDTRGRYKNDDKSWKVKLKEMLKTGDISLDISQSKLMGDFDNLSNVIMKYFQNNMDLYSLFINSKGVQDLSKTITFKHFEGSNKILTNQQLAGLKKELLATAKRFTWAYNLDPDVQIINTNKYGEGAYGSELYDIGVKFTRDKAGDYRKLIRSEVKNSLTSFHLLSKSFNKELTDMLLKNSRVQLMPGYKLCLILKKTSLEELGSKLIIDRYTGNYPFFEDGSNILLLSEILLNMQNDSGITESVTDYNLRQNYTDLGLTPDNFQDVISQHMIEKGAKFHIWYGKGGK